jgi:hypothetical protein
MEEGASARAGAPLAVEGVGDQARLRLAPTRRSRGGDNFVHKPGRRSKGALGYEIWPDDYVTIRWA